VKGYSSRGKVNTFLGRRWGCAANVSRGAEEPTDVYCKLVRISSGVVFSPLVYNTYEKEKPCTSIEEC